MTDLQMDTTKDAALRLCAEVVEERDALLALVRELTDEGEHHLNHGTCTSLKTNMTLLTRRARTLLARLDGRTA